MARRGGIEVAVLDYGSDNLRLIRRLTLTACGPSDGKEVKNIFGRPDAPVGEGSTR